MRNLLLCVLVVSLTITTGVSQEQQQAGSVLPWPKSGMRPESSNSLRALPSDFVSPKRPGHYTAQDWRVLIDSLWGPGLPTATKLQIFDTFWVRIDREFGGFPYLELNWDSLRALYRPEIETGVSRGRFGGIMSQLLLALKEIHTYTWDTGLDSVGEYSVYDMYLPGIPGFWPSGWGWAGNFGAALTPLPDSSLLVYRVVPQHPLDLSPGDIVLGYDGIPWKQLCREVLAAELPLQWFDASRWGSTPRSMTHALLGSAGTNWGLFDTIDVVKYATGDTVHLPTAELAGQQWQSLFATEQIPVPGVQLPDILSNERVSWGVVDNTSIGYVYVYVWNVVDGIAFKIALADLVRDKKVTGLILDFRYNVGSDDSQTAANAGLNYLFNFNPAGSGRWRSALRSSPTDHSSFTYSNPFDVYVTMNPEYFDRPIAILLGPQAWSFGDLNAFKVRSHPMARLFGRPTNGAFVMPGEGVESGPAWGTWYYSFPRGQMESLVDGEGFLMHKSFPVDEEVWLTQEGAARGEDDVVKRAIEWINTLSYAHDVQLVRQSLDTVKIIARVENPLAHTLTVVASLRNGSGALIDSLLLADDGLHGDSVSGDGVWGALYAPAQEDSVYVTMRTDDITDGTSRILPNAAVGLFTRGPVISVDTRAVILGRLDDSTPYRDTTFEVRNFGFGEDSVLVSLYYFPTAPDSAVTVSPTEFTLVPGDSTKVTFAVRPPLLAPSYYSAEVTVHSRFGFGQTEFPKSIRFQKVVTDVAAPDEVPREFALEQNYPNPFNPVTTLEFALPRSTRVTLRVFNMLGEEMATLVDGDYPPGTYTASWDASGVPSGVYFYRLRAEGYVETAKMVLMK